MTPRDTLVVSLTPLGARLAERIRQAAGGLPDHFGELHYRHRPLPLRSVLQQAFGEGHCLVLIMATGIAVRMLAPLLQDKRRDPPVLVLDQQGEFVVPLLAGHEGGADRKARELAALLGARPVITGAGRYFYVLGVGCERGCGARELYDLCRRCFAEEGLDWQALRALATLDRKCTEPALLALSRVLRVPLRGYAPAQLRRVEDRLSVRSDAVFRAVGCYGVAEAAALVHAERLMSGESGKLWQGLAARLVVPKRRSVRATCSVAGGWLPEEDRAQ